MFGGIGRDTSPDGAISVTVNTYFVNDKDEIIDLVRKTWHCLKRRFLRRHIEHIGKRRQVEMYSGVRKRRQVKTYRQLILGLY